MKSSKLRSGDKTSVRQAALLTGVSAFTLAVASGASHAAVNPFARVANSAAQQAAVAANQGQASTSAAQKAALAALSAAQQVRSQINQAQAQARAKTQAAFRSSAAAAADGLGPGGLQPTPGGQWSGALLPRQSVNGAAYTVDVDQKSTGSAQAILTWDSFNVGANTTLNFLQNQSSDVVLNRVLSKTTSPSQILGSITAKGKVYILNQNGIIFGGASQVNVGGLIAAAAKITDDQFNMIGVFSASKPTLTDLTGQVTVQAGAQLMTPQPSSDSLVRGGYIALMGTTVENHGLISTPSGQTLLVAGDQVWLRKGYDPSANKGSTTLGIEAAPVFLSSGASPGTVTNTGMIEADTGDISLVGRTLVQNGALLSTSTTQQRGTIHLLTSASDAQSSVSFGPNSVTEVLPDLTSSVKATDAQRLALLQKSGFNTAATGAFDDLSALADRPDLGRIEVVTGGLADFKAGSLTLANGGQIAVQAGLKAKITDPVAVTTSITQTGRIQVEAGATLDVSGVQDVQKSVADNFISVNVQPYDLRDSPVNRDNRGANSLINTTVSVDTRSLIYVPAGVGGAASPRDYTPGGLLEVSGYLANQQHKIGDWASVGGAVTLSAGTVVTEAHSSINLAGGYITYAGDMTPQTVLLGADGKTYTLNNAPLNIEMFSGGLSYDASHPRWGKSYDSTFSSPFSAAQSSVYEAGYVVQRDGGALIVSAQSAVLDGDVAAQGGAQGARQTKAHPTPTDAVTKAPSPLDPYAVGQLAYNAAQAASKDNAALGVPLDQGPTSSPDSYSLSQSVVARAGGLFVEPAQELYEQANSSYDLGVGPILLNAALNVAPGGAATPKVAQDLPSALTGVITLDPNVLSDGGLGALSVKTLQAANLTGALSLSPGGALQILAGGVTLDGTITAPAGSVSLTGLAHLIYNGEELYNYGPVTLKAGAQVDTRGLFVDQRNATSLTGGLGYIHGGSVTLKGAGLILSAGSKIDASAGASISPIGAFTGGNGGDITLVNDEEGVLTDEDGHQNLVGFPQTFLFDGTVRSQGFGKGGALTVSGAGALYVSDGASDAAKLIDQIHKTQVLPGQTAAPMTLSLDQDLVLHAGETMPFTWSTKDLPPFPVGVPLKAPIAFYGAVTLGQDLVLTADFNSLFGTLGNADAVFVDSTGNLYGVGLNRSTNKPLNPKIPRGTVLIGKVDSASGLGIALALPIGFVLPPGFIQESGLWGPLNGLSNRFNPPTTLVNESVLYLIGPQIANTTSLVKGSILATDIVIPRGTLIPAGAMLSQDVQVGAVNRLAPSFFQSGFSAYKFTSDAGVSVAPGTQIDVVQPLLAPPASLNVTRGTIAPDALVATLGDLYSLNLKSGVISQRAGADVSLSAVTRPTDSGEFLDGFGLPIFTYGTGSLGPLNDATITIGQGAVIAVDPGRSIALQGPGQQTIDGALIAHGGAISITDPYQTQPYLLGAGAASPSIWLGATAKLDASGQGVTLAGPSGTPVVVRTALAGGSVTLGTAANISGNFASVSGDLAGPINLPTLITRPGSDIDVSGAAATGAATLAGGARSWAGDAGSVTLASTVGIVQGGQINAFAGGPGALGGALSVNQGHLGLGVAYATAFRSQPVFAFEALDGKIVFRSSAVASAPTSQLGATELNVDGIAASGFTRLAFSSPDAILFDGDVNLTAGQSLVLSSNAIGDTLETGQVALAAPYVRLGGARNSKSVASTDVMIQSQFSVRAGLLDIQNTLQFGKDVITYVSDSNDTYYIAKPVFAGFGRVNLYSDTDIRLINTSVNTPGDLNLTAERVYATGGGSSVWAGGVASIARTDTFLPAAPLTYGDSLNLAATAIYDDGVIWQPFGSISFFGPTLFKANSYTSVSGFGLTAPFGGTSDGATYNSPLAGALSIGARRAPGILGGIFDTVSQTSIPNTPNITLVGGAVSVDKGAVLDVRGGGQLLGEGFVRGKGGSIDVLNNPYPINPSTGAVVTSNSGAAKVYALVPGVQAPASPISPATQAKGADALAYSTVNIPTGVPGLPAGTYTLLPGDYALAPGAYRVQIGGSVASGQAGGVAALADGSYQVGATLGYLGMSSVASAPVSLILSSASVVAHHAQYNRETPDEFVTQWAVTHHQPQYLDTGAYNSAYPYRSVDGDQLKLLTTGTFLDGPNGTIFTTQDFDLRFAGQALFASGDGGASGSLLIDTSFAFAEVKSSTYVIYKGLGLNIYSGKRTDNSSAHNIDVAVLNAIAAPAVTLIGGNITFGADAVLKAGRVTVESEAADALVYTPGVMSFAKGAGIDTTGFGAATSQGIFLSSLGQVTVGAGASLITGGSFAASAVPAPGATAFTFALDPSASLQAGNFVLSGDIINIVDPAKLGQAPNGLTLSPDFIAKLAGSGSSVKTNHITLIASSAIDFIGGAGLDFGVGSGKTLTLEAPALTVPRQHL